MSNGVKARRGWAMVDTRGNIKLDSIGATRQEAMSTTLDAYKCGDEPAEIRRMAEEEMLDDGWRCVPVEIRPTGKRVGGR